jgi:signal transduction histidine kinase
MYGGGANSSLCPGCPMGKVRPWLFQWSRFWFGTPLHLSTVGYRLCTFSWTWIEHIYFNFTFRYSRTCIFNQQHAGLTADPSNTRSMRTVVSLHLTLCANTA